MGKWKGFGGQTRFWEQSLEPMTLMSAIAACTRRLKLIATINPVLALLRAEVDTETIANVRRSFDRDKRVSSETRMAYMKEPTTIGFI